MASPPLPPSGLVRPSAGHPCTSDAAAAPAAPVLPRSARRWSRSRACSSSTGSSNGTSRSRACLRAPAALGGRTWSAAPGFSSSSTSRSSGTSRSSTGRHDAARGRPALARATRNSSSSSASSSGSSGVSSSGSGSEGESAGSALDPTPLVRRVSAPASEEESVAQAAAAVQSAVGQGHTRLLLELLLPLICPSLLDDWPGGVQQQLRAATPLVTSLLERIEGGGAGKGSISSRVLVEEDAVTLWESPKVSLVLFPTSDVMPTLQQLAESSASRPLLIVNPQWQPGQVVSDFGFGAKRKAAEALLASFVTAYSLRITRIRGSQVTIVRSFPSDWCVYKAETEGAGGFAFVGSQPDRPSYRDIERLLVAAENSSVEGSIGFFGRLAKEFQFLKDAK